MLVIIFYHDKIITKSMAMGHRQTQTPHQGQERTMNATVIITNAAELRAQPAPLFHQYPGQDSPQPAFIELDCESRSAEARFSGEVGNAVPAYVWHRRALRFAVPSEIKGGVIAAFLESEEFQVLARRICDGYEKAWDGSSHVGRYTSDAREAMEELQQVVLDEMSAESAYAQIVSPEDYWANEVGFNEYETEALFFLSDTPQFRININSTDEELEKLARHLEDMTEAGVEYSHDVTSWLRGLRDSLNDPDD